MGRVRTSPPPPRKCKTPECEEIVTYVPGARKQDLYHSPECRALNAARSRKPAQGIRLSPALRQRIQAAADERRVSMNYLIERALDEYLP